MSVHGLHTDIHASELEDRSALIQAVLHDAWGWSVDFTVSLLTVTSRFELLARLPCCLYVNVTMAVQRTDPCSCWYLA